MAAADHLIYRYDNFAKSDFVMIIILALVLVALVILSREILRHFQKMGATKIGTQIGLFVVMGALAAGVAYFSYQEVLYARDKSAVENRQFETVTGKVIRHTGRVDANSPSLYTYSGVIIEFENGDSLWLKQSSYQLRTKLNETYEFVYLKHSRLAVATEINESD
ncbi:MAG: hypothetical protein FWE85_00015 [Clostridiales bacterium]|nr:hypothetical protein [Clostridiales bacterium]